MRIRRYAKRSKQTDRAKILSLWTKATKDELVSYKELIKILKSDGVSERTVARHLLTLMKENKLEKIEQGYKKTFYKTNRRVLEKRFLSKKAVSNTRRIFEADRHLHHEQA